MMKPRVKTHTPRIFSPLHSNVAGALLDLKTSYIVVFEAYIYIELHMSLEIAYSLH